MKNRPVHSLFLDRGLNFHGGVTKALLNLARSVDPTQLKVAIGSLEQPEVDMIAEFAEVDAAVTHLGDRGYLGPALKLRRLLSSSPVQLVICNSFRSYLITKLATLGLQVRVLFWIHIIGEIIASRTKVRLFRWLSQRDTLIFITKAARDANLPAGHRGQHHVVYYGIENPYEVSKWQPYDRQERQTLGLTLDDPVLMYVGSFVEYKDQETLMRAVDQLSPRYPRLQLLLVGQGERLPAMQAVALTLAARDRIHFLGPRADARQLLGVADIYVHPAHPEAFGLAVAEAMLAGLPVVGAADGGIPEIVQSGVNGLLFEPGNVNDLVLKLEQLLSNPVLAQRLAQAGTQDARERFAPPRFAEQMTQLLLAEADGVKPRQPVLSQT